MLIYCRSSSYNLNNNLSSYTFQRPLQPLSDTLSSAVYQTFEKDRVKYENYRSAIGAAVVNLIDELNLNIINVFVLGAGRGPLVSEAIKVVDELKQIRRSVILLKIVAVEKNSNAFVTLQYCNEKMY